MDAHALPILNHTVTVSRLDRDQFVSRSDGCIVTPIHWSIFVPTPGVIGELLWQMCRLRARRVLSNGTSPVFTHRPGPGPLLCHHPCHMVTSAKVPEPRKPSHDHPIVACHRFAPSRISSETSRISTPVLPQYCFLNLLLLLPFHFSVLVFPDTKLHWHLNIGRAIEAAARCRHSHRYDLHRMILGFPTLGNPHNNYSLPFLSGPVHETPASFPSVINFRLFPRDSRSVVFLNS
ncbi:hypothetical protein BKA67DRAFT_342773 [Truncatella angustata]|uniref:Uncharacterized protein n=1 Tax=Truncatella angustata TaxID=152316 RepID=A0A9P8UGT2_9PEZI|nr:uncharacterized protein BKA67DRAFT_342773 [Truncatella angustata]KAH6651954.1 hypothetical protein BKA67DRAFT_342773 [Truncatella angustata]